MNYEQLQAEIDFCLANDHPWHIAHGTHSIDKTLRIAPLSGSQQRLHIRADNARILWQGPDDHAMIYACGWKNAIADGLSLNTGLAKKMRGFDIGSPNFAGSTSGVLFQNCQINFNAPDCIGWRASADGDQYGDVSALSFVNCFVRDITSNHGAIGWQALMRNNLAWSWYGGGAVDLKSVFSNHNPANGAQHGGGSMSFYGLAASRCALDFDFYAGGVNTIVGGRFELGKRFAQVGAGASFGAALRISGANIASYAPVDGAVIFLGAGVALTLEDTFITRYGGFDYDKRLISVNALDHAYGSIRINGGGMQVAEEWFKQLSGSGASGRWARYVQGALRLSTSSAAYDWLY